MKSYDYPLVKVIRFNSQDIITTSGIADDETGGKDPQVPTIPTRDPETNIPMGGITSLPD